MASILPPFPRFVFTIFEPIALVAGYLSPMLDTKGFVNSQLPATVLTSISPTATNRLLALQLGNVYGLLAMIGVGVLYATTEAKVVRNFLLACAIADVGHLGYTDFMDVSEWNSLTWGNIGITLGLLVVRVFYLLGAFGQDKVVKSTTKAIKDI
ncbi:hypothetical protein IMSHALPRED_007634 [Imshaugia aleurites]|uniref:DUF7704 domain-containing protein n=1 Tax=Imshaugia aleurites TaxID=172621 RepID=A0A8H3ID32_9LECA|nr:hypothetical protein IMSHALPRED_007634 [Imshaugia aleurites]